MSRNHKMGRGRSAATGSAAPLQTTGTDSDASPQPSGEAMTKTSRPLNFTGRRMPASTILAIARYTVARLALPDNAARTSSWLKVPASSTAVATTITICLVTLRPLLAQKSTNRSVGEGAMEEPKPPKVELSYLAASHRRRKSLGETAAK